MEVRHRSDDGYVTAQWQAQTFYGVGRAAKVSNCGTPHALPPLY